MTVAATPAALGTDDTLSQARHQATTHILKTRPVGSAASGGSAFPAMTEALDQAELPRMKLYATFGSSLALSAFLVSFILGGDPTARWLFRGGLLLVMITNLWLLWLTNRTKRYQPKPLAIVWAGACLGVISAIYYFGPYSGVVAIAMFGITFAALAKSGRIALMVVVVLSTAHALIAVPIALRWVDDISLLGTRDVPTTQLLVVEPLLVGFFVICYTMGRWLRRTTSIAMAEVERAKRIIGDQEVALAEVRADAARNRRVGEGRWTGQTVGSFELGLVLGRGAMGEVYEAKNRAGVDAAVKVLTAKATDSPQLHARFHREMSVAASLASPHIVKVYEVSPPDAELPYLAMERLYGRDLATILRAQGRLDTDGLLLLVEHLARGLEVARTAGVVHRDLKPHNVFCVEVEGKPPVWKILDFGVSKLVGGEGTLTGEGIVGTPQYMAPEQAAGKPVTPAADIYAVAAIAYRCMTGRPPFTDGDLAQLVYKVVHAAPARPSTFARVGPRVEDVLAVGLAKDPAERFPTATAFARALATAKRGVDVPLGVPKNAWA